ncbi:transglycosylase SLT domain-containing protein [Metabacillus litoralis]|uniref:transglycosylase SLT domain-containing protein n=1 Tax=Metabacillus litoralis TaxID=152268 RepID=UPI000EF5B390|nr:transglycosylase SLT domain-containing protein [Metabacillus litoralis]
MRKLSLSLLMIVTLVLSSINLSSVEAAYDELSYQKKKELIVEVAKQYNIPPEILKAIAYSETGMKQFDSNGNPIVSDDGGIGMMQITLSDQELADKQISKERLLTDTEYNIKIGAQILNEKWGYNFIPKINDHDRSKIEHWYFAVWAYNGLSKRNDPNEHAEPYQEKVFDYLRRDNTGVKITATPKIETSYKSDGTLQFTKLQYNIDSWNTPSVQAMEAGDVVYTSKSSLANGVSNLRDYHDTVGSSITDKIEPLSKVKILAGPYESTSSANFFSFFKVSVNGKEGYMATSNLQGMEPATLTVPHATFPTNHRQPVGRVIIRDDVPLLRDNKDGTFTITETNEGNPTLVKGEMIKLFGAMGDYYNVGGDYYIKRYDPNMVVMIARANTRENIKLFVLKDGKLTEQGTTYGPGHNLRVYDYDSQYVYVGGSEETGLQVLKNDGSVLLYKGFATAKKPVNMYAPDGSIHKVIQPGERARVYSIDGDRLYVGGGYYLPNDKGLVNYSPH